MRFLLGVCFVIILWEVVPSALGTATCIHQPVEMVSKVHQKVTNEGRVKRQSGVYEPLRINFYYDDTITTMLTDADRMRLQNTVIPNMKNYFESSLNVTRATSPILLERSCNGSFFVPLADPRKCVTQCVNTPMCGTVVIPEDHLKRCVECDGSFATCGTRTGSVDGPGVPDTDLILYVTASDCSATSSTLLAFAGACEQESDLDRPIAGYINFCHNQFDSVDDEGLIRLGIHEAMHALGFSSGLYSWFRDENGIPRSPRNQFGFPITTSNSTVQTVTYNDWSTRNGNIDHTVSLMVTPNVMEQARLHFNCSDIMGVELENQGGGGTALSHWEQRIVGNEGMAGISLFGSPYSRITLGLLQDTGWYVPNYEMADPFAWGLNTGCTIPHGSCRQYIQERQTSGQSISPYCDDVTDSTRGCTVDHEYMSFCNLRDNSNPPPQFQFFDGGASYGGTLETADYCPFESGFFNTRCSDTSNGPTVDTNYAGQYYGAGSRCFLLGRQWSRTNESIIGSYFPRAGCYQFSCTTSGVEIILEGVSLPCSCEGEEIVVDLTVGNNRYEGSYICPSCASVCYDDLANCPATEPAPCPGKVSMMVPDPCLLSPCNTNATCTRASVLNSNYTCACNLPYEGDGFTCEIPVSDPCSSSPCDTNAVCTQSSDSSYTCTCSPPYGGDGFTCQIVPGDLLINVTPSNILSRGDNVTLTCSASGGPDNVFQWQKNGTNLPGENQATLQLTDIDATDGGEYTCVVSNAAGSDSTNVSLYIRPYIVVNPQPLLLTVVRSSVTFTCEALSFPPPSYQWEKDGVPGFVSTEQNYMIGATSYSSGGVYRCVAFFTLDMTSYTTTSEDGLLVVSPEGSVTASPNVSSSFLGDTQTFTCSAMGGPGNTFLWTRLSDGVTVGNMSSLTVSVEGAGDSGMYRCEVTNLAGSDSSVVTLNVPDPCDPSPCDVNAICIQDSSSFNCTCNPPFIGNGFTCEIPDPCVSGPCDVNAECTRDSVLNDNFTCTCNSPFEGDGFTCEIPNPCNSGPCDTNAECVRDSALNANFTCTCTSPFEGDGFTCEIPDPCNSGPCHSNAVCARDSVLNANFTCTCTPPFEGDGFTCDIPDPCVFGPCDVNAVCTRDSVLNDNFTCTCNSPFEGDGFTCEMPDPCLSNPCDTNAVCTRDNLMKSNFTCTCNPPYEGDGFTCHCYRFHTGCGKCVAQVSGTCGQRCYRVTQNGSLLLLSAKASCKTCTPTYSPGTKNCSAFNIKSCYPQYVKKYACCKSQH